MALLILVMKMRQKHKILAAGAPVPKEGSYDPAIAQLSNLTAPTLKGKQE